MKLKSFREDKLKMTQAQFAELIGEEQSNISRWEKSGEPPLGVIEKICQKTGVDFNTLLGWNPPSHEALNVKNSWGNTELTKRNLKDYIEEALNKMYIPKEERISYIDDLQVGILDRIKKPKISIVGRSDTGKSTMINSLLGMYKMPTSWTPTTSIAVYIKHISDRPSFIEEDVWVFASKIGEEDYWDEKKLGNEEYCRKWKIGAGTIDIIRAYGTRQGEDYSKNAGSAVVFLDAPVLLNCDIIDLPGFGTETESDDIITFKVTRTADVIIYLSQAIAFMRIEDINYLKQNISELPIWENINENKLEPLCNLFIVGSQAHIICGGNKDELNKILETGCNNLTKTLSEHYWDERQNFSGYKYSECGKEELKKRFFAYTTDIPEICEPFNEAFRNLIETLPQIIESKTKKEISAYVRKRKPNLKKEIETFKNIMKERERYVSLLQEIENNEVKRISNNNEKKQTIRCGIIRLRDESIKEYSEFCSKNINIDTIVSFLKERKVKNKKDDIEAFASWFQEYLKENCEEILKIKSEEMKDMVKDYINFFSESVGAPFSKYNISVDFDVTWAFTSAIDNSDIFGELNVSLIRIAVLLGSVSIALGVLLVSVLGVVKLFGGGWEKRVAKKFVKAIEEKEVVESFRKAITEYWNQTTDAFNNAVSVIDDEFNNYVDILRKTVEDYNVESINKKINILRDIEYFFDNIPL